VPGSSLVLRLFVNRATLRTVRWLRLHRAFRLPPAVVANLRRAFGGLAHPAGRAAFLASLRSVIAPSGQRGNLIEMALPRRSRATLIVWSEHDHVIPVSHARALHEHLPSSRLALSGRQPPTHWRHATDFAALVAEFLSTTEVGSAV